VRVQLCDLLLLGQVRRVADHEHARRALGLQRALDGDLPTRVQREPGVRKERRRRTPAPRRDDQVRVEVLAVARLVAVGRDAVLWERVDVVAENDLLRCQIGQLGTEVARTSMPRAFMSRSRRWRKEAGYEGLSRLSEPWTIVTFFSG
jgi:hypothetical protein